MSDAAKMMRYDASKKTQFVAYLLWFFLGGIGAHRFYAGRTASAVGYIVLHFFAWLTLSVGLGVILFIGMVIWWAVDAFLIPGLIRQYNLRLAADIDLNVVQP